MDTPGSRTTQSIRRRLKSVRWGLVCAVVAVALLLAGFPAGADAVPTFLVDIEETITWQNPQTFPNSFSGDSSFMAGNFCVSPPGTFCGTTFDAATYVQIPVLPADPVDIVFAPSPILPNDTIIWQFGGFIHAGPETFYRTFAFAPGTPPPAGPPAADPIIVVGLNLTAGFAPIDITGPIYTFTFSSGVVQAGTYEIRVGAASAPEPGSLLLVGIALAVLVTLKSRVRVDFLRGPCTRVK